MRIFLLAMIVLPGLSLKAPAATRTYGVTGFTSVRVEGPYKVTLTTGVPPFARATGSSSALDRIAIEVRGQTIVIHNDPNAWGGYPGSDPGPVEVSIGTHEIADASLTGSGTIAIDRVDGLSFGLAVQGSGAAQINDVAADQLTVSVAGSGNVKLAGRAKRLTALVRGLATLDAAKLATPDARLSAQGSATIDATVSGTARIDATGPVTVRLRGSPSCEIHVAGSTSVSGCK